MKEVVVCTVPEDTAKLCARHNCQRPLWTTNTRGKSVTHSELCYEHSNIPLFHFEPEPPPLRSKGMTFRDAVRQRRREREQRA